MQIIRERPRQPRRSLKRISPTPHRRTPPQPNGPRIQIMVTGLGDTYYDDVVATTLVDDPNIIQVDQPVEAFRRL